MSQLLAFHNDQKLKQKIISQLKEHYNQDQIIKGQYWENGKGCAIGCTIHSDTHKDYEKLLGIPEWVAKLEDILFERMLNEKSKELPLKLIQAIPVGFSNWQHIYHQLCVFILENICKNINDKPIHNTISKIITLHKNEEKNKKKWSAVKSEVRSVESATRSAAWSAARSATRSAAWSAESVAMSAAWAVEQIPKSEKPAVYFSISEKLIGLFRGDSN